MAAPANVAVATGAIGAAAVFVASGGIVAVALGVRVAVFADLRVAVGQVAFGVLVGVAVLVRVLVAVGVLIGVFVGDGVFVGVDGPGVFVGVDVLVGEGVFVDVDVAVGVDVFVRVAVGVKGLGVLVDVLVGHTVGVATCAPTPAPPTDMPSRIIPAASAVTLKTTKTFELITSLPTTGGSAIVPACPEAAARVV